MKPFKHYKTALKVIISLTILGLISMRLDWNSLKSSANAIHLSPWIWATGLMGLQILLISTRWGILVNVGEKKIPMLEAMRITIVSMIANVLFITSIGGVVVRVALAMQHGVSFAKALFATLLDRMMTLMALLILTVIFISYLKGFVPQELYQSLVIFLAALCFAGLFALPLLFSGTYNLKLFHNKRIEPAVLYLKNLLTDQIALVKIVLLSVLAQTSFLLSVFIIIQSSGYEGPILPLFAILPVLSIIASLPIGFGGWGIREGAFIYGLGLLGFSLENSFLISVQVGLISILATVIMGLPALMTLKDFSVLSPKKLKAAISKYKLPNDA